MSDDISVEANVHAVRTQRTPDGGLAVVEVEVEYAVRDEEGEQIEDYERAVVEYEIKDGTAFAKHVCALLEDGEGNVVQEAGLRPNALRVLPEAEYAVLDVPGVGDVEPIETVVESVVSTARHYRGEDT